MSNLPPGYDPSIPYHNPDPPSEEPVNMAYPSESAAALYPPQLAEDEPMAEPPSMPANQVGPPAGYPINSDQGPVETQNFGQVPAAPHADALSQEHSKPMGMAEGIDEPSEWGKHEDKALKKQYKKYMKDGQWQAKDMMQCAEALGYSMTEDQAQSYIDNGASDRDRKGLNGWESFKDIMKKYAQTNPKRGGKVKKEKKGKKKPKEKGGMARSSSSSSSS